MVSGFRLLTAFAILFIHIGSARGIKAEDENPILIFAASSLTAAIDEAANEWATVSGNPTPKVSVAASAVLARQIEAGAPADLFISANDNWTRYLSENGHVARGPMIIAGNRLVFVVHRDAEVTAKYGFAEILKESVQQRFILADPNISPAGAYAKAALQTLGLWDVAKENAVYAGNVRLALALIERSGTPGFVYASDLVRDDRNLAHNTVPARLHTPITYSAVALKKSVRQEQAQQFLSWLRSESGRKILVSNGFQTK